MACGSAWASAATVCKTAAGTSSTSSGHAGGRRLGDRLPAVVTRGRLTLVVRDQPHVRGDALDYVGWRILLVGKQVIIDVHAPLGGCGHGRGRSGRAVAVPG